MGAGDTNAVDAGSGYLGKLVTRVRVTPGVGHFFSKKVSKGGSCVPNKRPLLIIIWGDIIMKYILLITLTYFKAKALLLVNRILSKVVLVV